MIVKIKSHKRPTFKKLLNYMLRDKDRLYDENGKSFVVAHNLKGNNIDNWEKQLKENETYRKLKRANSVYFTHEILSWHKDDAKNISLEKMETMAREYIRLRNPKGIFIAAPHFDKSHCHVHILASGVGYKTGKALRLSKTELTKLKKDIQLFQQERFPELSKSIVAHGKKESAIVSEKEYQVKFRAGRETEKEVVIAKLKTCYKKANSKATFLKLLNECGLKTYERGGKITGVVHGRYKFRFKRLGFTEMEELDKTQHRKHELNQSRSRGSTFNIQKGL